MKYSTKPRITADMRKNLRIFPQLPLATSYIRIPLYASQAEAEWYKLPVVRDGLGGENV